jgi:predicted nucleic acid-binding protein
MYLLDTNVVSMLDVRRHASVPDLIVWLERNGANLYLSVMTITEVDAGAHKLRREGKSRRAEEIAGLVAAILADFADRVLPIDIETARHVVRLAERTHRQPVALPDLFIAATAMRHGLTVLTRNLRDFDRLGVAALDPFAKLPKDI